MSNDLIDLIEHTKDHLETALVCSDESVIIEQLLKAVWRLGMAIAEASKPFVRG